MIVDYSPHSPKVAAPIPTASNLVLIDNYDSFTWNVYQYLVLEGAAVTVFRNDKITLQELIDKKPTQLVISPGPGHPKTDSGISKEAIRYFAGKIPVLGICMGLQCMIDLWGGEVAFAGEIVHGKASPLMHDGKGLYKGLDQGLAATRYHSLAGTYATIPECLEVSSWIAEEDGSRGIIMGARHKEFTVEGVQFHPESILSQEGRPMIRNFLHLQGGAWDQTKGEMPSREGPANIANGAKAGASKENVLQQIYRKRKTVVEAQKKVPSLRPADLQAAYKFNAAPPLVSFVNRLSKSPFPVALMAEIKRASPSKGVFAADIDAPTQAHKYALAGASVISVLTEPDWFKGSIDDLRAVRQVLHAMPNRPAILRKDFIFDQYQILEARLAGADTILLIVKMLEKDLLHKLYHYSRSLGMEPLVEVQNAEEMKIAVELEAQVIGVNNRNLETFDVDTSTTSRLRNMAPESTIVCALSGIGTHEDVKACQRGGVNAILVGESIMRAPDASAFIHNLCTGTAISSPESTVLTPPLVKICGTRTPVAAATAVKAGADLIGMICVPSAKRCVTSENALAISKIVHDYRRSRNNMTLNGSTTHANRLNPHPSTASDFFSSARHKLSNGPLLVGVFMNQPLDEVLEKQRAYNLDVVQLHGDEPVEWASLIPVPVIKKFKPGASGSGQRGYHIVPLLDSGAGSGKLVDMRTVTAELERDSGLRIMLAGGLDPDNVASVMQNAGKLADRIVAVDVSSGVEEDGEQSCEKIRSFVYCAKNLSVKES